MPNIITNVRFWVGKGSIAAGGAMLLFHDKFGHVVAMAGPCVTGNCYQQLWTDIAAVLPWIVAVVGGVTWEFLQLPRHDTEHAPHTVPLSNRRDDRRPDTNGTGDHPSHPID